MSSRRGHLRREARQSRHSHATACDPDPNVGVVVGWCAPDSVDECKQQTHDVLLELMGDRRAGGVVWKIFEGVVAREVIKKMELDSWGEGDTVNAAYYAQINFRLGVAGGLLVVATALAK